MRCSMTWGILCCSFQCYVTCKAHSQQTPHRPKSKQQPSHECEPQPLTCGWTLSPQSATQQPQASLRIQPSHPGKSCNSTKNCLFGFFKLFLFMLHFVAWVSSHCVAVCSQGQAWFKHNAASSTDGVYLQAAGHQGNKSSQQQGEDGPAEGCGPTQTGKTERRSLRFELF